MQQIAGVWSALDLKKQVVVIAATLGVFAAVLGLARLASAPNLSLLYAGLEPAAAGEVISSLEQQGVAFEVRGPGIYVDTAQRDALRMALASQGLPANGSQGYELLDSLSGFGTTSQMFDAAYWRAKEGELARTIMANPGISSARVHLSNPVSNPFRREGVTSASVTVNAGAGVLTPAYSTALGYLVASAVSGLDPANVAIIDGQGRIVPKGDEFTGSATGDARAEQLRKNVMRLLEARVGPGNALVELSVDTRTEREQITERIVEPDSRVAISQNSEESSSRSSNQGNGGVTVASNLPAGQADGAGSSSESSESETRETVNYDVSETRRELIKEPGSVRRITVAVLVDGVDVAGPNGDVTWQPRTENELADLRELVASAVGFDEARGDTITIKSMELTPPVEQGTTPEPPGLAARLISDPLALTQMATLALVSLVLGLFVVRPILMSRGAGPAAQAPGLPAPSDGQADALPALSGEIDPIDLPGQFPEIGGFGMSDGPAGADDQPSARLRRLIEERQDQTVELLNSWIGDEAPKASR